jgi:hypothetical protein
MTKTKVMRLLLAAALVVSATPYASAQNAASNKAVFAYNPTGVSFRAMFDEIELFNLPSIIKTSSNGSLLLGLSMECSLYTYNSVTSTGGGSKNSTSARATVRAGSMSMARLQLLMEWSSASGCRRSVSR